MKNHNVYNGGIADVWYSGHGHDLWVEYKFIVLPKRDSTMIDLCAGKNPELSHLQQDWLRQRSGEGRNVGVIVGCKEGGVWYPDVDWLNPLDTQKFKARIISRPALANLIKSLTEK